MLYLLLSTNMTMGRFIGALSCMPSFDPRWTLIIHLVMRLTRKIFMIHYINAASTPGLVTISSMWHPNSTPAPPVRIDASRLPQKKMIVATEKETPNCPQQ